MTPRVELVDVDSPDAPVRVHYASRYLDDTALPEKVLPDIPGCRDKGVFFDQPRGEVVRPEPEHLPVHGIQRRTRRKPPLCERAETEYPAFACGLDHAV